MIDVILQTFSPGPSRPARASSKVVFPELGGPKSSVILQHEPMHVHIGAELNLVFHKQKTMICSIPGILDGVDRVPTRTLMGELHH